MIPLALLNEGQLALLFPIVAIILGCSIPIVIIIVDFLRKKHLFHLYHEERMAAINKGIEAPPLPEGLLNRSQRPYHPSDSLRRGLVWLFVGVALYFVLPAIFGQGKETIGFIPMAIGLANLLFYALAGRKQVPAAAAGPAQNKPVA